MPLLTFPAILPSYGSDPRNSFRVLEAKFGDGYSQRAGDGLHGKQTDWTVLFENLEIADSDTIRDFLDARGGVEAFLWTPPNDVERKFVCQTFSGPRPTGHFTRTIRATFREVFDIA